MLAACRRLCLSSGDLQVHHSESSARHGTARLTSRSATPHNSPSQVPKRSRDRALLVDEQSQSRIGGRIVNRIAAFLLAAAVLGGCSNPKDAVIPSDMSTWDKELAPALKGLPDADREKVAAYLMRIKLGEVFGGAGVPPGMTIGQALEGQRKWETEQAAKRAEEEALKKRLEQERAMALEQLNKAVTVTLLAKQELPKNYDAGRYSEYQQFRIGVQNNSDKEVIGVAGEIKFVDVFDKEVGGVTFAISENISPGGSVTWIGGRDFNQFQDTHRAVWNLEDGKYTTRFVPETIVYKDGTKLTVPK